MNRDAYLILFGALVTLSVLTATDKTEDTLSEEIRATNKNLGKSREKLKKAKRNKKAKKKNKSKRNNKKASKKNRSKKKSKKVSKKEKKLKKDKTRLAVDRDMIRKFTRGGRG